MGINKIMNNALKTKWNLTDEFMFTFSNQYFDLEKPASRAGMSKQDLLNMCVMNIDMPQLSGDIDAVLHGGQYRLNAKKFSPFVITVTFRDIFGLKLRDYFLEIWAKTQTEYFEDIISAMEITTQDELLFKSDDCIIASVSQVQLDNASTQISEFSVEFQTAYYTNSDLEKFGLKI